MSQNKVTREMIESKVKDVRYYLDGTTTICVIEMNNGWREVGTSACIDPANYNEMIGQVTAYTRALDALFKLEGYLMKEKLHQGALN